MQSRHTWTTFGILTLSLFLTASNPSAGETKVDFNRDVQPILSANCYACHGPDKEKRKSGYRLDTKEGAFAKLKSDGFGIVIGKPQESVLLTRINNAADDEEHMPPAKSGKELSADQKQILARWIAQGAEWKPHWSYIPPVRPLVPTVASKAWCRNPVDNFIVERLEKEKVAQSPEADKVTLIRRLSFDLRGLPPSAEDAAQLNANWSDEAYEKLVDRYLASAEFGERMAIYWLDLVRFADTIGYHSDNPRDIAPYRDYVIQSFNENKPFDKFTTEQLAGDLIPNATLTQKIASGYNRLNQTTEEGGAQAKEYEAKYAADRVRNISSVWMAGTMGCCECHNHKFDPYTMKDFYSLAAFFADISEASVGRREKGMLVPDAQQAAELKALDEKIAAAQKALDTQTPELTEAQNAWEKSLNLADWTTLTPVSAVSEQNAGLKIEGDGAVLVSGTNPEKDSYTIKLKTKLKNMTALRLDALPAQPLPKSGPGRSGEGHFVLTAISMDIEDPSTHTLKNVPLQNASASAEHHDGSKTFKAAAALTPDKDHTTGWDSGQPGQASYAIFETNGETGTADETLLTITLKHEFGKKNTLGHFRLSATTSARPVHAIPGKELSKETVAALKIESGKRSDAQKNAISAYYRNIAPGLDHVRSDLDGLQKQRTALVDKIPASLVSVSAAPRVVRIKARGNWMDDSGEICTPAVPHFLPQINNGARRATRLDLAQWLVSSENPLTARVFVNRMWKLYFGQGLSKSLEDLGAQGEPPSHPDLLDWLAVEFRESGWDIKHIARIIVTSNTYRQSSIPKGELKEKDPYNRLYARQSRFRLDAEIIRDNALAISGLLVEHVGGMSVKPYQPKDYWSFLNFPTRTWQHDHGENEYRRGLYTFWQRTFLHPSLLAFDAPSREECICDRARSNTPQQALVLLNDPTYVEAARVFAEQIAKQPKSSPAAPLDWAFMKALNRHPSDSEQQVLLALLKKHTEEYQKDPKAADALAKAGETAPQKDENVVEVAAWTSVARVILNLHETITRY